MARLRAPRHRHRALVPVRSGQSRFPAALPAVRIKLASLCQGFVAVVVIWVNYKAVQCRYPPFETVDGLQ